MMYDELCGVMCASRWQTKLREVCVRWRDVYDVECPRTSKRCMSRNAGYRNGRSLVAEVMPKDMLSRLPWMGTRVVCMFEEQWTTLRNDVATLRQVHTLILYGPINLTNMSIPATVHTLKIYGCSGVNVSSLATVRSLVISSCACVTDVSSLATMHTLKLYSCHDVTDVSMLATVHNLVLCNCKGIRDVYMLLNKPGKLSISECRHLADVEIVNIENANNV